MFELFLSKNYAFFNEIKRIIPPYKIKAKKFAIVYIESSFLSPFVTSL